MTRTIRTGILANSLPIMLDARIDTSSARRGRGMMVYDASAWRYSRVIAWLVSANIMGRMREQNSHLQRSARRRTSNSWRAWVRESAYRLLQYSVRTPVVAGWLGNESERRGRERILQNVRKSACCISACVNHPFTLSPYLASTWVARSRDVRYTISVKTPSPRASSKRSSRVSRPILRHYPLCCCGMIGVRSCSTHSPKPRRITHSTASWRSSTSVPQTLREAYRAKAR
jgi:hypothetical protein